MVILYILFYAFPGLIVFVDFIFFCFKGRHLKAKFLLVIAEIGSLILLPLFYAGFGKANRCCVDELDTTAFSPAHQLTIAVIVILCLIAYIFSKFRKELLPPIAEVFVNVFVVMGVMLSSVICFHVQDPLFLFFGPLPIVLLFVMMLTQNHQLFIEEAAIEDKQEPARFNKLAWRVLSLKPLLKFPLLLIICLPVLFIIIVLLLLFGQKPDSLIRAFTDTYKHGFSQWDYKCDNVNCGGHYLCSVAANGHKKIVKPLRLGKRNGNYIVCNRQLLVSNAFEELLQEKCPFVHKHIRRQYNKVGNAIHRHYWVFNNKYVSDIIYWLMKPFEIVFIMALYTFDKKPENRIVKQYMK